MTRLLTTALALVSLGAIALAPLEGGPFRGPQRVEGTAAIAPRVSVTDATADPATSHDPRSRAAQPGRFDNLWSVIVGVVGLSIVVQLVRIERRGRLSGGVRSWNESSSSGVFSDE